MINSTLMVADNARQDPRSEDRLTLDLLFRRALPALAAWINPQTATESYWVRGQDTLTFGDQARWFQLKAIIAKANEIALVSENSEHAVELGNYDDIFHFLSHPSPTVHSQANLAPVHSAASALQPGNNAAAIALLNEWLADESGYDEKAWPIAKEAIERNRLSDRKRFGE